MKFVTIDFESFYSSDYSLSKMTTEAYIRDERFKSHGCGIKVGDAAPVWVTGSKLQATFDAIDWSQVAMICQNTMFDGAILAWHYGKYPKLYIDTLGMSRALIGAHSARHGLKYIAPLLGVGDKGDELAQTMGIRDLSPALEATLARYCKNDCDKTYAIFKRMAPHFPKQEYKVVDWTIRAFTDPKIWLDTDMLQEYIESVRQAKADALAAAGLEDRKLLMSNPKFAEALEALGCIPPTKINAKGKVAFAFAKTDEGLKALLDHPDTRVAALVAARLEVKSTIEETRAQRLLDASTRGPFPVPYNYAGANVTQRFSGADKVNCVLGDTEVLTRQGWVRLDSLQAGVSVAQWSPDGRIDFVLPRIIQTYHDGELIEWDNTNHRMAYTPEHRLPVKTYRSDTYRDILAQDVTPTSIFKLPVSGVWGEKDPMFSSLRMARVAAAIRADGHVSQKCGISFSLKKTRKHERLRGILQDAGLVYSENVDHSATKEGYVNFHLNKDSTRELLTFFSQHGKRYGPWVMALTLEEKVAMVEEERYWDGHSRNKSYMWSTSIEDEAMWFQVMCHTAGYSCNYEKVNNNRGYGANCERELVLFTCNVKPRNFVTIEGKRPPKRAPYTGNVWCLQVPSSYFMCRRKGRIVITGNCQNLSRSKYDEQGNYIENTGMLRRSIYAPEGYTFGVADLAQIECRITLWFGAQSEFSTGAEQTSLDVLASGGDLYGWFGSLMYGREINKRDNPTERQIAKSAVLGLGYGMGAARFIEYCAVSGIKIDEAEAARIVKLYRDTYQGVKATWRELNKTMAWCVETNSDYLLPTLPVTITRDPLFDNLGFKRPCGLMVKYPDLHFELNDQGRPEHVYRQGAQSSKLFGGKYLEGCSQSLAGDMLRTMMMQVNERYDVVMSTHDELVCLVPEGSEAEAEQYIREVMTTTPSWIPGLPLGVDIGFGRRYGEVK